MAVTLYMRDGSKREGVELRGWDVFPFDVLSYRTIGGDVCTYHVAGQSVARVEILGVTR